MAGFTQAIVNTDGTVGTVDARSGFPATVTDANGKTVPLYPADIASVNHSHIGIARKIALDADGVAQNSEYALTEEGCDAGGWKAVEGSYAWSASSLVNW